MTNKEAKRILQFCICIPMKTDEQREAFNLAIKALEDRPTGEWINQFIGGNECVMCSECKLHFDIGTNFCPNCGAEMRKGGAE